MARSLTIRREEEASTSPLLTGFLLLAAAWLLIGALLGAATDQVRASSNARRDLPDEVQTRPDASVYKE